MILALSHNAKEIWSGMVKKGNQDGSGGLIYGVYILRIYPSKVLLKLLRKMMKR